MLVSFTLLVFWPLFFGKRWFYLLHFLCSHIYTNFCLPWHDFNGPYFDIPPLLLATMNSTQLFSYIRAHPHPETSLFVKSVHLWSCCCHISGQAEPLKPHLRNIWSLLSAKFQCFARLLSPPEKILYCSNGKPLFIPFTMQIKCRAIFSFLHNSAWSLTKTSLG